MTWIRRLALGVVEFVVGEDWRIGVGVAIALGVTALVAEVELEAWWVTPFAALALLAFSVRRADGE
jgi:hypothetical protein